MHSHLTDRQDPLIADLFRRLDNAVKILEKLETTTASAPTFNGLRFLTDKELAAILGVTRRTLLEYRTRGHIPYYLICGKILYSETEIMEYLESCRRRSLDE
jgi:Predicted site-specific integrase-resolvase